MELNNFPLSGYRINEYLLVLSPHQELWHKIMNIKKEFAGKYKTAIGGQTKPHITLVNFLSLDMMEERIIQRLQTISMGVTPFKIELKDYGSFPSHTIFINVISRLPIQNIIKELKIMQRLMKLNNENKPHLIEEPFLAIARK